MLLLELREFFFSSGKVRFSSSSILLGRHMVQHNDVTFLQVEAVQMIQCILGLNQRVSGASLIPISYLSTYVHNVVKYYKRRSATFLLTANAYLPYATIPTKEVVQVFTGNLVV